MFIPTLRFEIATEQYGAIVKRPDDIPPSSQAELTARMRQLKRLWKRWGGEILWEISFLTQFAWHEKDINVYLLWGVRPFSSPLTLNPRKVTSITLDDLTHELVHRIISSRENRRRGRWKQFRRRYADETKLARIHVYVHAVHKLVMLRLFGEARFLREKSRTKDPDYVRAWEIVERDGAEAIVASVWPKPKRK